MGAGTGLRLFFFVFLFFILSASLICAQPPQGPSFPPGPMDGGNAPPGPAGDMFTVNAFYAVDPDSDNDFIAPSNISPDQFAGSMSNARVVTTVPVATRVDSVAPFSTAAYSRSRNLYYDSDTDTVFEIQQFPFGYGGAKAQAVNPGLQGGAVGFPALPAVPIAFGGGGGGKGKGKGGFGGPKKGGGGGGARLGFLIGAPIPVPQPYAVPYQATTAKKGGAGFGGFGGGGFGGGGFGGGLGGGGFY